MKTALTLTLLVLASPVLAERIIHVPGEIPTLEAAFEAAEATEDGVRIILAPGTYYEEGVILQDHEYFVRLDAYGASLNSQAAAGIIVHNAHLTIRGLTFDSCGMALGLYANAFVRGSDLSFIQCDAGPVTGIITVRDSEINASGYWDEVSTPFDTICISEEGGTGYFYFVNTDGPYCRIYAPNLDIGAVPVLESSWGKVKASYR